MKIIKVFFVLAVSVKNVNNKGTYEQGAGAATPLWLVETIINFLFLVPLFFNAHEILFHTK